MKFEDNHFIKFEFSKEQVERNFKNALKDYDIAKKDEILEVKFGYAYSSLIKTGIALLSFYNIRIKSVSGHHIKIIGKMADILQDERIADMRNLMRSKRNLDFYGGGIEVTEKECIEYIRFVDEIIAKAKNILSK